ncbi:hypothetical protein ROHU_013162 [Labeo rohita]|uniref:Uncharacterized protein n=1 Tax=Labeo rohita TaxID=84645 RepID=A0A498L6V1_LABRO|nr:hypothetical protein ROHU_013162 [Labeo rohita]
MPYLSHMCQLLTTFGPNVLAIWEAINEPGPRPSSHTTHSLPASVQPFTVALPATALFAAGPLASVSRDASSSHSRLSRGTDYIGSSGCHKLHSLPMTYSSRSKPTSIGDASLR